MYIHLAFIIQYAHFLSVTFFQNDQNGEHILFAIMKTFIFHIEVKIHLHLSIY